MMGPHVMHVSDYSFNRSCLVDVVHMLFTTQQWLQYTSYQKPHLNDETFPALAA